MLHIQVDPHSGVPVYRQAMDQIEYYVASKVLAPGDQLPSIRELAKSLRVNPTTVVKAYTELEHKGVIEMKHGKGAFISESVRKMSEKEIVTALRRVVRQLAVEATQMGAPLELVMKVLKEEMQTLANETKRRSRGEAQAVKGTTQGAKHG